jgi:hypothetical protein
VACGLKEKICGGTPVTPVEGPGMETLDEGQQARYTDFIADKDDALEIAESTTGSTPLEKLWNLWVVGPYFMATIHHGDSLVVNHYSCLVIVGPTEEACRSLYNRQGFDSTITVGGEKKVVEFPRAFFFLLRLMGKQNIIAAMTQHTPPNILTTAASTGRSLPQFLDYLNEGSTTASATCFGYSCFMKDCQHDNCREFGTGHSYKWNVYEK